jgi:hypothetical protein
MCGRTYLGTGVALALWLAALAAADEARVYESQLQRERMMIERSKRALQDAPPELQAPRKERLAVSERIVQLLEQALAAAKANDTTKARALAAQAGDCRVRGMICTIWEDVANEARRRAQPGPDAADAEKQIHQRMAALQEEAGKTCQGAQLSAGDLDRKALDAILKAASQKRTAGSLLQQALQTLSQKRMLENQRPKDLTPEEKAVYDEGLGLHDQMAALIRGLAESPAVEDPGQHQEFYRKRQEIQDRINAWRLKWQALDQERQFTREAASAPPERRALLAEIHACAKESLRVRQLTSDPKLGDAERRQLEARAEIEEQKADILRAIGELRAKSEELGKQSSGLAGDAIVADHLQTYRDKQLQLETMMRERAKALDALREAREKVLAGEVAEEKVRDELERLEAQVTDGIARVAQRAAFLGAAPSRETAESVATQYEEDAKRYYEAVKKMDPQVQADAEQVSNLLVDASQRADMGKNLLAQDKADAARAALAAAWDSRQRAEPYQGWASRRAEIARRLKQDPVAASRPEVKEALAAMSGKLREAIAAEMAALPPTDPGAPEEEEKRAARIESLKTADAARAAMEAATDKVLQLLSAPRQQP